MPTTRNLIWTSFVVVTALLTGWMGLTMVLHEPLRSIHDANGTLPALQAPIDAVITLALTALFASVVYRGLSRRRASMAARTVQPSMTARADANAVTTATGLSRTPAEAGLATTR